MKETLLFNGKQIAYSKICLTLFLLISSYTLSAQSLSGNYVIGGSSPNYSSFTAAVSALHNNGVSGPVNFTIAAGTYNEQISINAISGASSTNTITFDGVDTSTTKITFNSATNNLRHTILLNGASYITIKNITIEATGAAHGWGIHLMNNTNNIEIINNQILTPVSTSLAHTGIVASGSATSPTTTGNSANNVLIKDNYIHGGYANISLYGAAATQLTGITIDSNQLFGASTYAVRFSNVNAPKVTGNNISLDLLGSTTSYGISISASTGPFNFSSNKIQNMGYYGIYVTTTPATATARSLISNNMIGGGFRSTGTLGGGIRLLGSNTAYIDIFHNSINVDFGNMSGLNVRVASVSNLRILNNIFAYTATGTGYALYISDAGSIDEINHNNYYSGGSNFVYYNGSALSDLSSLQNVNIPANNDGNSYSTSPPFLSATDLHIDHSSSFYRGPYIGIATDIDGDARCTIASTLGADESEYVDMAAVSSFSANDTLWKDAPQTVFNNASVNDLNNYTWLLNGQVLSTAFNLKFNFPDTGSYSLALITENCNGKDTMTKAIYVSEILYAPTADFVADKTDALSLTNIIQLEDRSTGGATSWEWIITPEEFYDPDFQQSFDSYGWNSGSEFSQNPSLTFFQGGYYNVCLVASNAIGSDTVCKINYLTIRNTINMCTVTHERSEVGLLFDDGGQWSNYSPTQRCSLLIDPCASEVSLGITDFDLGLGTFLRVFDGKDNTGVPLWNISAYPNGMTGTISHASVDTHLVAQSGFMYIEFNTGAFTGYRGFAAEWNSVSLKGNSGPEAHFYDPATICADNEVIFENASVGNNTTFMWFIDDVLASTDRDFVHTFSTSGNYAVKLITENCIGSDSSVKTVNVINAIQAPVPGFGADHLKPNITEPVIFSDSSTYCIASQEWIISPSTFTFINGTNANSKNPQLRFTSAGCYDVSLVVFNSSGSDTLTKFCYIEAIEYCIPVVQNRNSDIGISHVQLEQIDNQTAIGNSAYSDYTSTYSTELVQGATYNITLSRNTTSNAMSRAVWIDFNQNGTFEPGERVAFQANSTASSFTGSISIPSNALLGPTRMRVGTNFATLSLNPCGPSGYGEFEDYRIYIIRDTVRPVIAVNPDTLYIEQGYGDYDRGVTAMDNADGDITSSIMATGTVDTMMVGTYYRNYTVTDFAGNTSSQATRVVIVTADSTEPVITLSGPNPDTLLVLNSYTEPGYTAYDLVDGDVTGNVAYTDDIDSSVFGTYTRTYTVSDANGNIAIVTRAIIVADTAAPVITLTGGDSIYWEAGNAWADPGYSVTDNYDQNLQVTVTGTVDVDVLGTYILTYCAGDLSGNNTCVTRTVTVGDTTAPVIMLLGNNPDTVWRWANYTDPGYTVTDNHDAAPTVNTGGTFAGTNLPGEYIITYVATDQSGNTSDTVTRTVVIKNPTGIAENSLYNSLNLYPNPGNGLFHLNITLQKESPVSITIMNVLGKEVMQVYQGNITNKKVSFNLTHVSPGIYYVKISSKGETAMLKVVKN